MKISIFGLGYVGCVSAACFTKLGHRVIGSDVVDYKVEAINNADSPLEEKGLKELIKEAISKKLLSATKDTEYAVLNSDVSFICVGTPATKTGDIDLTYLKKVCKEIALVLRKKSHHLIVLRSTMFPGSIDILQEIIEKTSRKKAGKDFDLVVNPEFMREGSAVEDFFEAPFIIIGSDNINACKKVSDLYKGVNAKRFFVKARVAEMIKYANNSFHALKITFANEISAICKQAGVDSKKLMSLFCEDKQLNISPYYFKPGFAYGGSCLPKDTAALQANAKKLGVSIPLLNSVFQSNNEHIKRAIDLIESKKKKKIGFLGLTFKADTDDIRGNPVLLVINYLLNKKYEIKIFDRLIDESDIELLNKSYRKEIFDLVNKKNLKENIGTISSLFSNINSVLQQDIIVLSNRDDSYLKSLKELGKNKKIIDLQNLFNASDFKAEYSHL